MTTRGKKYYDNMTEEQRSKMHESQKKYKTKKKSVSFTFDKDEEALLILEKEQAEGRSKIDFLRKAIIEYDKKVNN